MSTDTFGPSEDAASQPGQARRLAAEYRPTMDVDVLHSWAADAAAALSATCTELDRSRSAQAQAEVLVGQWRAEADADVKKYNASDFTTLPYLLSAQTKRDVADALALALGGGASEKGGEQDG